MVPFPEKIRMIDKSLDILLDTNILIYSTLKNDARYQTAQSVLLENTEFSGHKYTTTQNLGEMYPNLTGPKMSEPDDPVLAKEKIESIAALPNITVLPLTNDIVSLALELSQQYGIRRQKYFDMQIAAFMLRYSIPLLITENTKDFEGIENIIPANPFLK
jgi:predicted nucleic acid-binding protein